MIYISETYKTRCIYNPYMNTNYIFWFETKIILQHKTLNCSENLHNYADHLGTDKMRI